MPKLSGIVLCSNCYFQDSKEFLFLQTKVIAHGDLVHVWNEQKNGSVEKWRMLLEEDDRCELDEKLKQASGWMVDFLAKMKKCPVEDDFIHGALAEQENVVLPISFQVER
ncbi:unnamed protein product [Urochloa humidicola]